MNGWFTTTMVDVTAKEQRSSQEVDVVALTALAEEKAAFLAAVGEADCEVVRRAGDDIYIASVGALRIAVASVHSMGNVGASAMAREMIEVWRPRFLLLVGIAAGIRGYAKDMRLGDVLVADQVVGFELGKVTREGLQRRYQSFPPNFDLLAAARSVTASEWSSTITTPRPEGSNIPRMHVGAMLSGEKVFADTTSVREIGNAWPTAIGVEMEGLGVAIAAHRGGSGFLLVKGISDFADAGKDDRWRAYAAEAAARFTLAVLRRQSATPMRRSSPRPRQLPGGATGFTGRAAEVTRLLAMALDPSSESTGSAVVISAIDGMAGIGKTALAVHVAHRLVTQYPDGQLFIDLHGFTEGMVRTRPMDALDRLLRDVGIPGERIPDGLDERAALWRSVLAGRRMLIVLDNAGSEAQVQPLLPGAPGCLVLVTSRRRLAALEATHTLSLDVLPPAEAAELFARTADRPELAGEARGVSDVVELCGRLPLAIRIAASRLKHRPAWTVHNLVERLRSLDARLATLEDGHRSVHATLQLSYQFLSANAQRLYRLLGLHPGPDVEPFAATALVGGGPDEVRRLLSGLVDDHMLAEPTPGRYRFHDLVRAHAATTAASEELPARQRMALGRLLDYYQYAAAIALNAAYPYERQPPSMDPPESTLVPDLTDQDRAYRWLDTELANLLAAAHHATRHGWPAHTWQLSTILDRHLRIRGRYREAQMLHQDALDLARTLSNRFAEMNASNGLGHVHVMLGNTAQANEHHSRALQIARSLGAHEAEMHALNGLGYVHVVLGRHDQAGDYYGRALEIARSIGTRSGELHALNGLGDVHRALDHYEYAAEHDRMALEVARNLGDRVGELQSLHGLGEVYRSLGRYDYAEDHYAYALGLARDIGDLVGELQSLQGLGHVYRMLGRLEQAESHFGSALRIAKDINEPTGEANSLNGLGHVYRALGHHSGAARCYQQVFSIARQLGSSNWQYEALHGLGRLRYATGYPELAVAHHRQALQLATELSQPADQARAHDGLAYAYQAIGEREQARRHWQHALEMLTSLGTDHTEDVEATVPNISGQLTKLDQPPTTTD